jgi:hypothetical protein
VETAVQVQDLTAAGALVQIIDILGDQSKTRSQSCQGGYGQVCRIGLCTQHMHAAPFVPTPDKFFVVQKCLRCGKFFGIEPFPKASPGIAKGWNTALCGDTGTRKDDNMPRLAQGGNQTQRNFGGK